MASPIDTRRNERVRWISSRMSVSRAVTSERDAEPPRDSSPVGPVGGVDGAGGRPIRGNRWRCVHRAVDLRRRVVVELPLDRPHPSNQRISVARRIAYAHSRTPSHCVQKNEGSRDLGGSALGSLHFLRASLGALVRDRFERHRVRPARAESSHPRRRSPPRAASVTSRLRLRPPPNATRAPPAPSCS